MTALVPFVFPRFPAPLLSSEELHALLFATDAPEDEVAIAAAHGPAAETADALLPQGAVLTCI